MIDLAPGAAVEEVVSPHFVRFYEEDANLVEGIAGFLGTSLVAGGSAVSIATSAHRDAILSSLVRQGVDLAAARGEGRFLSLDADETLSRVMNRSTLDADRFQSGVGELLSRLPDGEAHPPRLFGEMVSVLWSAGNREAALALERLWSRFAESAGFSLLCAYPMSAFLAEADTRAFLEI